MLDKLYRATADKIINSDNPSEELSKFHKILTDKVTQEVELFTRYKKQIDDMKEVK